MAAIGPTLPLAASAWLESYLGTSCRRGRLYVIGFL